MAAVRQFKSTVGARLFQAICDDSEASEREALLSIAAGLDSVRKGVRTILNYFNSKGVRFVMLEFKGCRSCKFHQCG